MASKVVCDVLSSNFTNFKCCKTKSFLHFVCIQCLSIYHKTCIPRFKNRIEMVEGNQIICCRNELINITPKNDVEDTEIFKKIINELKEDNSCKDKHIECLKISNSKFVADASFCEAEMNEIIKSQEEKIKELNNCIEKLKISIKNLCDKETKTVATQTKQGKNFKKSVSTNTSLIDYKNTKPTHTGCPNKIQDTNNEKTEKNIIVLDDIKIRANNISLHDEINLVSCMPPTNKELYNKNYDKINDNLDVTNKNIKKRVLILGDDNAKYINKKMNTILDPSIYEIISVIKPGARLTDVMNRIDFLADNYT